ncbi:uncharacterized protein BDR25DRAFT_297417 [Lindgomyces ingoldianus]|uniref:Uncharacterized protein n=1 Tax=Lindgomyces ingoldianus TaxID=673940 RepID=A0ACB6QA69_9PLEO|nr:uncharacterized protein BDR25DRAFT_297417 [Lindgomyces ingoldianus]KAF2463833.1 hypothetical protein BDR25DRAFT_297417 [Lindgomyces ingoldianus]
MGSESLILVMGVTGAGKSYFINQLKPNSVTEGHSLVSQTKTCKLVQMKIGACTVAAVDTPGFDDDEDSDAVVLSKITRFLTTQYLLSISLKGIILLHDISSTRFSGSEKRYLNTFRQICGEHAFANVALVTTMWASVDKSIGLRREEELQIGPWADLISKGSYTFQYNGTPDMAQTIAVQMMAKDDVVLQIQEELKIGHCKLESTSAGAKLAAQLEKQLEERRKIIQDLNARLAVEKRSRNPGEKRNINQRLAAQREKQLRQIRARDELRAKIGEETEKAIEEVDNNKKRKREKWKSRLQIFAAALGPVIALTVNLILPLAGVKVG